jgi:hypothetical protein
MSHTNTWETDGLYRQFSGEVSGEEILKSNLESHEHHRFHDIKYVINDFTRITGHAVEPVHMEIYAGTDEMISRSKGRMKIALVVDQAAYLPLAEQYVALMEGKRFECRIFPTLEQVRQWVNE